MEMNTVGDWLGLIGILSGYVWLKVWMYKREYKDEFKKDI